MKLSSISVEDIMVTYTKKAYPLPDGMDLETTTDTEKNIITISVVEK